MNARAEVRTREARDVPTMVESPLRSDAQRNRERIVEAALAELAQDANVPLSAIAKRAGVGQGTLYRNFPDREALLWAVYHREVQRLVDSAPELLNSCQPDEALREWMTRLARFALTKAGLASALRRDIHTMDEPVRSGYALVVETIGVLLEANRQAGTIRPDITIDDFILAIAGIWLITPDSAWESRADRLLDLVMTGLQAGAPAQHTGDTTRPA